MTTQGFRLKEIREELRLNQSELANRLGIKSQSIWKAERDINKLSNESLFDLLSLFNVNINYLLAGRGEMFIKEESSSEEELYKKFKVFCEKEGIKF